jgi:acyl-CoA synthetase (AMP-forming)/AMP-acid ligase II
MSKPVPTVSHLIEQWSRDRGESIAFRFLSDGEITEQTLSFSELFTRSRALAARMLRTARRGDRVALILPASLEFVIGFFAALQAGLIAVPLHAPHPKRIETEGAKLGGVFENCEPALVITTADLMRCRDDLAKFSWTLAAAQWLVCEVDAVAEPLPGDLVLPDLADSDVALLQYTSGSSAQPKGVVLTHGNLAANQGMLSELENLHTGQTGLCSWLPHYHDMGLAILLFAVFNGIPATFMSPAHFVQRPVRWLQMLSRYGGTVTCAPNFALDLTVARSSDQEIAALDLSRLRSLILGAEPLAAESIRRFVEKLRPAGFQGESITPCYGLAEVTVLASGPPRRPVKTLKIATASYRMSHVVAASNGVDLVELVGCGFPGSGHEARICGPETRAVKADGEIGEIWLRGGSIGRGYWGLADASAETFNATTLDGEGGFLRTGDLGFLYEGDLYVSGRIKDLIIIRGRNIYPQDIERLVEDRVPEVISGGVAAFAFGSEGREAIAIVAEIDRHAKSPPDRLVNDIRSVVQVALEVEVARVVAVAERSIPKTSSGKLRRQHCKFLLEDARLPVRADTSGCRQTELA